MPDEYEYKVVGAPQENNKVACQVFQEMLNELGKDGWKVVGTGGSGSGSKYHDSQSGWAILMREK